MKRYILLLLLLHCIEFSSMAQTEKFDIPFRVDQQSGLKYIDLQLNGVPQTFIIDTGASGVVINRKKFMEMLQQGVIYQHHIIGKQKVILADGSTTEVYRFTIDQLKMGKLLLRNIEGYISPSDDAPSLLGQSFLDHLGSITFDNQNNLLKIAYHDLPFQTLKKIKFIPCVEEDKKVINSLVSNLKNETVFKNVTFEVEKKLPPKNAVDRVGEGSILLRYFYAQGSELTKSDKMIQYFDQFINQNKKRFLEKNIRDENMTPYYNSPIEGYMEIWVHTK